MTGLFAKEMRALDRIIRDWPPFDLSHYNGQLPPKALAQLELGQNMKKFGMMSAKLLAQLEELAA